MSGNRDYSIDIKTINAKVQAHHAEDLYEVMPCGHRRRYQLGNLCTVCEMNKSYKQVEVYVERNLGNYDLD